MREELNLVVGENNRNKKHKFWKGVWTFTYKDKDGNVIETYTKENALADEGEQDILDRTFRGSAAPASYYVRLYNDTPIETDTLATLVGEPAAGAGTYNSQALALNTTDFPTLALDAGDYMVTSKTITFDATSTGWGPVTYAVLATVATGTTGKLYAYVALSTSRTLAVGETLDVTMSIKLQ